MKLRLLNSSGALLLCLLVAACSTKEAADPGPILSVCEAADKGSELVGKPIRVAGWIQVSRHSVILGDRSCPSLLRPQTLVAEGNSDIPINLAQPADERSQSVKHDFRKSPTWPEWSFRGVFHGTLVARSPSEINMYTPLARYRLVITRIDEFRVERAGWLPNRNTRSNSNTDLPN